MRMIFQPANLATIVRNEQQLSTNEQLALRRRDLAGFN
jgi:hypothetical protein